MRRPRHALGRWALLFGLIVLLVAPPLGWGAPAAAHAPNAAVPPASHMASDAAVHMGRVPAPSVFHNPLPRPAAPVGAFEWAVAFIYYNVTDNASLYVSTHFMGMGASMVVDNHLRNITTFGGLASGGLTNGTVNYNYSSGYFWISAPNPSPTARTNASFADVPGRDFAVLFGGLTNTRTQRTVNDTWVYYYANQSWRNVTHGPSPAQRQSAGFAVNGSGRTAVLEGGWTPSYAVNGSSASVLWNDTWTLNLTTFDWSRALPTAAPPPLYASGMVWENATHRYELFGGCALTCSSGLWTYGGAPATWTLKSPNGGVPSPRAGAAFEWDGNDHLAIAVGGFSWGAQGPVALGDTYAYAPSTNSWSAVTAGGGPFPTYDAPNIWADFPGCHGFNIVGGSISLQGPPASVSLLEPLGSSSTNCWPNLISGGGGPPPPPCGGTPSRLVLRVVDNLTGLPVPNATVEVGGGCTQKNLPTDANGYLNLTLTSPDRVNFTARAPGYRSNALVQFFLPNSTNRLVLRLSPLPSLHIRAFGHGIGDVFDPLANVTIQEANFLNLGTTDAAGWLNVTHVTAVPGNLSLYGILAHYSRASTKIVVPYSGPVRANLTLEAAGPLHIEVTDATTGAGIGGASGTLSNIDPGAPRPTVYISGPGGWFNVSIVDAANYSLVTVADGYYTNRTTLYHPWLNVQALVIPLQPKVGAVVDALVRNAGTGAVIPGAQVTLVHFASNRSSSAGWANFTNVKPAGPYEVIATAEGYIANYTWVSLDYAQVLNPYPIELRPLPQCPGGAGCVQGPGGGHPPFGYLNGGSGALYLLIATPAILLGAGVLFAVVGGRRAVARAGAVPARRPGGPA